MSQFVIGIACSEARDAGPWAVLPMWLLWMSIGDHRGTVGLSRIIDATESGRESAWDLPYPYFASLKVVAADIDAYAHVNNSVYMVWFDRAAWEHSAALGLPIEKCLQLDRGMAVLRSVITYLRPAFLGDTVRVATWLLPADGKLRVRRRFQVRCDVRDLTLARADVEYACIELSSGRPVRWPPEFKERYVVLDAVLHAGATLAPV